MIEWTKELNTILLEFEGQLRPSDLLNMTRKELYYLRKERHEYHKRVKEQAEIAAEEAKQKQEKEAMARQRQANAAQQYHQRRATNPHQGTHRSKSSGKPRRR